MHHRQNALDSMYQVEQFRMWNHVIGGHTRHLRCSFHLCCLCRKCRGDYPGQNGKFLERTTISQQLKDSHLLSNSNLHYIQSNYITYQKFLLFTSKIHIELSIEIFLRCFNKTQQSQLKSCSVFHGTPRSITIPSLFGYIMNKFYVSLYTEKIMTFL
jgi:hypothetical protein